jgi:hypothetical protein
VATPVYVLGQCFQRGPYGHVHDQPVVTEGADRGSVAVLGLQPPDEARRRVGERVDPVKRGHEAGQRGGVQRRDGQRDVDLGEVVCGGRGGHASNLTFALLPPPASEHHERGYQADDTHHLGQW